MTDQQELWGKEKAKRHAGWAKLASRLYYVPFARKIVGTLTSVERDPTLVDLGIGPGILSIEVHKLLPQAKIIGIDPSSEMLEIARRNAEEIGMSNIETRLGKAEEIPIASDSVDLVFSQFSFHEWEKPQKGLGETLRILKPGGSLVLRDFNRAWFSKWKRGLFRFLITLVGESYEDHLEMFRFTPEEVTDLLLEAGFDRVTANGKRLAFLLRAMKGHRV